MLFAKKKFFRVWRRLYALSLKGMGIGAGGNCQEDGEGFIINRTKIRGGEKVVCFDCGANIGNYTKELYDALGDKAEIHAFEPSAVTFSTLKENTKNIPQIHYNNFGLSDQDDKLVLYSMGDNSTLASLYNRQLDYYGTELSQKETVTIKTIDGYCKKEGIEYIDLLKLDIEGNELKALQGSKNMLMAKKIGAIQLEFGGCNLDSRTYIRDFWNLLHENYNMYRVLSDGIFKIEQYGEQLELFSCQNFYFELK